MSGDHRKGSNARYRSSHQISIRYDLVDSARLGFRVVSNNTLDRVDKKKVVKRGRK